jgi:hypothetical protein
MRVKSLLFVTASRNAVERKASPVSKRRQCSPFRGAQSREKKKKKKNILYANNNLAGMAEL